MIDRDAQGAELARLKILIDRHEEAHNLPQRGFQFADSPGGTDAGRTWRFGKNVQYRDVGSALAAQRALAAEYGIA